MRNKYSKEFENKMKKLAPNKTLDELLKIAINKYNYVITKKMLMSYLSKRNIKYKNYNSKMVRKMGDKIPIGTEYKKDDGMVLVKISSNKWKYKQRLIYERYHNVKLKEDDYIIFLDQNRNNFNINNLKLVTRHESAILSNQKLFSKNPETTKTGIEIAKLIIKVKEIKNEKKIFKKMG